MLIIEFVPRNPEGGTNNLLPCPIAFMGNYSDAACEIPATWPVGDSFGSEHVSGVQVCESRGLMAVYAAPTLRTDTPERRRSACGSRGALKFEQLQRATLDHELLLALDRDGNGVDRMEFVVGMLAQIGVISWTDVQTFMDKFDEFDTDRSGRLDKADLQRMFDHSHEILAPGHGAAVRGVARFAALRRTCSCTSSSTRSLGRAMSFGGRARTQVVAR